MTLQEIVTRYGRVPLTFESYFKHEFCFTGTAPDGAYIMVYYGPDTYRYLVERNKEVFIGSTISEAEDWKGIEVNLPDGTAFNHYPE